MRIGDWMSSTDLGIEFASTFMTTTKKDCFMSRFVAWLSHVEVRIVTDAVINPRLILECRRQLWKMFHEVASLYPHTRNVHWDFGFYCPHAVQSGSRPHPARCYSKVKPQHVICSIQDCRGGPVGLENKHKCWFTVSTHKVLFST